MIMKSWTNSFQTNKKLIANDLKRIPLCKNASANLTLTQKGFSQKRALMLQYETLLFVFFLFCILSGHYPDQMSEKSLSALK